MARRYGNAGNVSSLISSARSAYEKTQAYQDQIAGLEWENSAKTAEDADKYKKYLEGRAKTYEQTDPMKYNTLKQKVVTTNRAFVGAEIGRASNQVMEGNMTNTQKLQQIGSFYQQAIQSGDENLAQRMYGMYDRLSITVQNEKDAAASAGAAASSKAYTAIKKGVTDQLGVNDFHMKDVERLFREGEIDRKTYLTKKRELLQDRKGVLDAVAPRDDSTEMGVGNPLGLKPEDLMSYAEKNYELMKGDNAKLLGLAGRNIDFGSSPFNTVVDQSTGLVKLQDRKIVGQSQTGPIYADNISPEMNKQYGDIFKKLGFKAGAGAGGMDITLDDGKTVRAFVDPSNPSMALYWDGGLPYHITPDKKTAPVTILPNGQIISPLSQQQGNISKQLAYDQFDQQLGGAVGVARKYGEGILSTGSNFVKDATKVGGAISKGIGGMFAPSGPGTSIVKPVGNALSQIGRIVGLQKQLDEKKARDAAAWAESQRQISAAQAASNAARAQQQAAARVQQPSAPALRYDFNSGKVINGVGAPAIPAEAIKSSKTPGTADFYKKYNPGVRL